MKVSDYPTLRWHHKCSESMGVSKKVFVDIEENLKRDFPHIDSILVTKSNYIIYEKYLNGYSKDSLHSTSCIFKGFISAATGIALNNNIIQSLDDKIVEIFNNQLPKKMHPKMNQVALKHALNKSTGLSGYPRVLDGVIDFHDDIRMILNLDVTNEPGKVFEYKPDPHILVYTISYLTGLPFIDYIDKELFQPLGIKQYIWETSFTAIENMKLRTRDIAKLGYLFLRKGRWEDKQLISPEFIEESSKNIIKGNFPEEVDYGYLWWVSQYKGIDIYFASGFGGQYLFIIPELDMMIVITSKTDKPHKENRAILRYILDGLLEPDEDSMNQEREKITKMAEGSSILELTKEQKSKLMEEIKVFFKEERDEDIGIIASENLLEFFINTLGEQIYNKALDDTKNWLSGRLEDMEADYYAMYK